MNKLQWAGFDSGIEYGGYLRHNVGYYLDQGLTDREAFDAAIAAVPDGYAGEIAIPYIGREYDLGSGYLQYGLRKITWYVEDGVTIAGGWAQLNSKTVHSLMTGLYGMQGVFDTGRTMRIGGGGQLGSLEDGVTGISSSEDAATKHERGRAGYYTAASDQGEIKIPAASFTATTIVPTTPLGASGVNPLRQGMYVDVSGTTFYAGSTGTVRYTSRVVDWAEDGSEITVDGWWRDDGTGTQTAVQETPPNGRSVTVNPVNKIWLHAGDVFLNKADGATYGKTSGSFFEATVYNHTGADFEDEFDQDTHPLHFYGWDANLDGDHGGGVPFMARSNGLQWSKAFFVRDAEVGFFMGSSTAGNNGGTALQTEHDGTNGPAYTLRSRSYVSSAWRDNATLDADQPIFSLGRDGVASTPQMKFRSGGGGADYDAQIYATGGTALDGQGDLVLAANRVRMGSHTLLGGEVVSGYITIKDIGGVERKLAVVS